MTETLVECQPAFILQHRPYRETSVLLDILTRDEGIIGVLAKGVRKPKSKTAGLLLPFNALSLSYRGKTDLKTLTHAELQSGSILLSGLALYCGFYANELISCFCHKHDPHPEVFDDYKACLQQLAEALVPSEVLPHFTLLMHLEAALRIFELNLMQHIGLGLPIRYDAQNETRINPSAFYTFRPDYGVIEDPQGTVSGKTLQAINNKQFIDTQTLLEAKQLMRSAINFHLHGKPLKSRAVLSKIYRQF